tara:strand:+ start:654 stop:2150 length:1497 start_codon:yes stop_codon:yes gene_type:complete
MVQAREGFEPSEIFTATAMFFSESELNAAKSGLFKIIEFFPTAAGKLGDIEFGTTTDKTIFSSYYTVDPGQLFPATWQVTNMAQGISAALAIKKWLGTKSVSTIAQTVYMTGKVWPDEVAPLNIEARGFKSYNSSDIIIKPTNKPKGYYGVSLKKKPTPDSVDPTMINKAFDTVLGKDKDFDDVKQEIVDARTEYFGQKVKDAIKEGHIHIEGGENKPNKWLFSGHKPADRTSNNMDSERAFIDTKGSLKMPEIWGPEKDPKGRKNPGTNHTDDKSKWGTAGEGENAKWNDYGDSALDRSKLRSRTDTMRAWVNKQLASDRTLYDKMLKVMNDNAHLFAETLIAVTLRTDILDNIEKKMRIGCIGDLDIGFALVTGIGKGPARIPTSAKIAKKEAEIKKEVLDVPDGKAYDIECVLEGLVHLDKPASGQNDFRFEVKKKEEAHTDDDGPAKLIFDLLKNNVPIMNMELRFKGGFTSQPQFFGIMTDEFKSVLTNGKCL